MEYRKDPGLACSEITIGGKYQKGRRTPCVAEEMKISHRRVQQMCVVYRATGRPGMWPTGKRTVIVLAVCRDDTSENAAAVPRAGMAESGTLVAILSDNVSCLVGMRRMASKKSWTSIMFETELFDRNTKQISPDPLYHPQTNNKLGRLYHTSEKLHHFGSLSEFMVCCNEVWFYWYLDTDSGKMQLRAFYNRTVPDAISKSDPDWIERDPARGQNNFDIIQPCHLAYVCYVYVCMHDKVLEGGGGKRRRLRLNTICSRTAIFFVILAAPKMNQMTPHRQQAISDHGVWV